MRNYDDNVMGQVMSKIFVHHSETDTCYTLTEDAEKVFEAIMANLIKNTVLPAKFLLPSLNSIWKRSQKFVLEPR